MFDLSSRDGQDAGTVQVGHWTDQDARTGCTVVLFDRLVPAVVDVRGGAPGTRETDLLSADRRVQSVDAIALCGGSAFGLAAVDGVMAFLKEQGRGVATPAGAVPIVPGAVIYDLTVGRPVSPSAQHGRDACQAAVSLETVQRGQVGAGTGATTGKVVGNQQRGGFGIGLVTFGSGSVTAFVVVNAAGTVVDPATGRSLSGDDDGRRRLLDRSVTLGEAQATTLGVVIVEAPIDSVGLRRSAIAAHDAFARTIRPCHTIYDGDLVFAVGPRQGTPGPDEILVVAVATELAMEAAILDAVTA